MTFEKAAWLWALAALPVLALFEWRAVERAKRAARTLVGSRPDHALLGQAMPHSRRVGFALRLGSLALLILGAAGPQWGRETVRRQSQGSDLVFVVDVSASMDARDVAPSRLGEARREALGLLDRVQGSRVGVVGFAGDAVRLCPLTLDRAAASLVIESLSSATMSMPGTDLGKGLRMALKVLPGGRREEQAIVLWTDGEDLEEQGRAAIDDVAHSGIRVFAVGVGTRAGDVVPVLDGEGRATDIKRDESGNQVRSRLDEALLRTLARRTRGAYFSASRPGGELPRLMSAIGTVASAARGERLIERPQSRFGWFATIAALLIALDLVRARRRRSAVEAAPPIHPERTAAAAAALLVLLVPTNAHAQSDWAKADRAFKAGRYALAESLYARRLKRKDRPELRYNHGTARALQGKIKEAEEELGRLASRADKTGQEAGYNLGTAFGLQRRYEPGLEQLRAVLEKNPKDDDARWNYEILMRDQEEEAQKKKNPDQPQQQQQQPNSGGGGGQGGPPQQQQQQQQQQSPNQAPTPQAGNPPPNTPSGGGHMSKAEAEQILDALHELSRANQQRQRKVRVTRERPGKDW